MMSFAMRVWPFTLFMLALCSGRPLFAQSTLTASSTLNEALTGGVPDAPSFNRQQNAAIVTQAEASPGETEAQRKARQHAQAGQEVKLEETQRIMAVVPNFNTVISGKAVPLSKGQKTDLALHATFDPFNFVGALFLAGFSEIGGSHRGYGWGPDGYFKRVGANLADVVDGTMLAGAVYPILLHQDPRFFRKATGTKRSRVRHALLAAFVCRGDDGRPQPNYSNVLGNLTAGLISNAYYPPQDTGISLSLINSSVVTAEGALGNIALEFAPDIQKRLHRKRPPEKSEVKHSGRVEGCPLEAQALSAGGKSDCRGEGLP